MNARISLAELLNKQNKTNEARAILQQTLINADNYDKEKGYKKLQDIVINQSDVIVIVKL